MAGESTAVLGVYESYIAADRAVQALRNGGFHNTDISIIYSENLTPKNGERQNGAQTPDGAAKGAGTGAVVGGAIGWLAGIGALAISGLGPLVAAGPMMAALAGAGVGGAVGGMTGVLVGLGIPEHEAKGYEGRVSKGAILISVHSTNWDWTKHAKDILVSTGAEEISSTSAGDGPLQAGDKTMRRAGAR